MARKLVFALIALALPLIAVGTASALPSQYPPSPSTVVAVTVPAGPQVLGQTLTNTPGTSTTTSSTGLARTGVNLEPFALVGGLLILVGAFALVSSGRIRRRPQLA